MKAGGKIIQHVFGHNKGCHHIIDWNNNVLEVSSTHHQMMFVETLPKSLYKTIAISLPNLSSVYENGEEVDMLRANNVIRTEFFEPEIVLFPDIKALAIQSHPEFASNKAETVSYCRRLVTEFMQTGDIKHGINTAAETTTA